MEGRKVYRNSFFSVLTPRRKAIECDSSVKHVHLLVTGHQESVHTGGRSGHSRVRGRPFSCFVQQALAEMYVHEELKIHYFRHFLSGR